MRSGNPALSDKTFTEFGSGAAAGLSSLERPTVIADDKVMTLDGTVSKSFALLAMLVAAAGYTWYLYFTGNPGLTSILMLVGVIGGFIVALITIFKKTAAPITAPLYAILEGFALGGISATYESQYGGIVMTAVGLTFGTLFSLLSAYATRLIKPTENFKLGVVAATGGIAIVYLVTMILSLFHVNVSLIYGNGPVSIGISLFIVLIAALNLVLDFDFIESGVAQRAPKFMEWYAGFGLLVTLVWLYLEILRLLAKFAGRSRD
jgi:uncharacterized YccA/Bax inhibitor family protein